MVEIHNHKGYFNPHKSYNSLVENYIEYSCLRFIKFCLFWRQNDVIFVNLFSGCLTGVTGAPIAPVSTHDNILSIKHHFRTAGVLRVQRVHFRVH